MIITHAEKVLTHTEYSAATGTDRISALIWQEKDTAAALGIAQQAAAELNTTALEEDNVRIIRRQSGGGAVILGAGVVCFEVIAPLTAGFENETIKDSFISYTLPLVRLLQHYQIPTSVSGISDISVNVDGTWRKIAGCAQLRKKSALVVHASVLVNLDRKLLERYLKWPTAVPDYRANRSHTDFCLNLSEIIPGMSAARLAAELQEQMLLEGWHIIGELPAFSAAEERILTEKYQSKSWNIERKRPKNLI